MSYKIINVQTVKDFCCITTLKQTIPYERKEIESLVRAENPQVKKFFFAHALSADNYVN